MQLSRLLAPLLSIAAGLSACLLPATSQAFCGFYAGKADASLFNQASQVVIVRDGPRTVMSMMNDYSGPLDEFVLVVPTPTAIQKGQVRVAEKAIFERLDAYSTPRLAEYHDNDPCQIQFQWGVYPPAPMVAMAAPGGAMLRKGIAADRAHELGVTVEAAFTLEEYDIVSLSAKQSDGLETWLIENGYKIPKGASAALKPYINQGMKFFVAKVNLKEKQRLGYAMLRPLQFAYESEKFILPVRLGMLNAAPDKPQDLIAFVLTKNGRVETSNYRTVKLPANMNLPFFVKPKFQDFYKALFDTQAKLEAHKVVFTEYFWDMSWCDPCAANPLSTEELRKAGVFWVGGDEAAAFDAIQKGGASSAATASGSARRTAPAVMPVPPMGGGAQPVMLTRLHMRYTPLTLPEDLMLTQTADRTNWQTRYVIQQPYAGSLSQCSDKTAKADCAAMCKERVDMVIQYGQGQPLGRGGKASSPNEPKLDTKDPQALARDCAKACETGKRGALLAAAKYYDEELPKRLAAEKQTLAKLTGWSMAQIDAMPDAQKFGLIQGGGGTPTEPPVRIQDKPMDKPTDKPADKPWWEKLFHSALSLMPRRAAA